jgi:hypothetical protein
VISLYPKEDSWQSYLLEAELSFRTIVPVKEFDKLKKFSVLISN